MTPAEIDRVFGRGRLRMTTGEHVEVFREEAREGEERRYTKRFLETSNGDFRPWTEREWRILDRLGARGDAAVARVVRFFPADDTGTPRLQTRDCGPTVDQWASLVALRRTAPVLPYVFGDAANWWALARQCLLAFEPLHALGFVHLDFKADNVCVPWKPTQASRPVAGQPIAPDFDGLALIDVAFSLLPGVDLPGALPLAREAGFEYQSPRLLEALDAGRRGDLAPTLALDWRCDFFSIAAMLWRYLPELEDAGGTGWTRERHDAATLFVRQLLEIHGAPLAAARPHRALIGEAALWLAEPQLAAALQAGSSFDPERTWPNGAEATPLTRVVATSLLARDVRIEPEFAAPTGPAAPADRTAATATAAATTAAGTFAPTVASAEMAPPVVDDEVTVPIGAPVDLPLDVRIDVVDFDIDVPLAAPLAAASDVALEAPQARALDASREPRDIDVAFAAPPAKAFDGARALHVADAPGAALASAVGGGTAAPSARERAAATVTARSSGPADTAPPVEPAWPTLADDEPAAAAAPARRAEPPQLPPPSSMPILAAAGVGAILVALAAWWQLDGRARFDRGAERAAAPAAPSVVVPMPPETVAAEPGVAPANADAVPQTTDVAATPEASPATAASATATPPPPATTISPPPAVAVNESDRGGADPRTVARAELEASAATWMRERLPRLAQAAERRLAPVLAAAARSPELRRRAEVRSAAQSARVAVAAPAGVVVQPDEAQRLHDEAITAARREGGVAEALRLQTQAFGANPLDPAIAGNLALLHLREASPQPEPARQLALHALTLKDDRFPTGRTADWTTLAIAAALTGREAEARNAWFVSMALASDLQQQCDAALRAQATYGARVRPSVQAMLQRARSSAAYGRCEVPQAALTEKRASTNVKSKSTHKPRRPIP